MKLLLLHLHHQQKWSTYTQSKKWGWRRTRFDFGPSTPRFATVMKIETRSGWRWSCHWKFLLCHWNCFRHCLLCCNLHNSLLYYVLFLQIMAIQVVEFSSGGYKKCKNLTFKVNFLCQKLFKSFWISFFIE